MKKKLAIFFCACVFTLLIDITFAIQIGGLTWLVSIVVGFFLCFLCFRFQIKKHIELLLCVLPLLAFSILLICVNPDLFYFIIPIIYLGLMIGVGGYILYAKIAKPLGRMLLFGFVAAIAVTVFLYGIPRYYVYLHTYIPTQNSYFLFHGIVNTQGDTLDLEKYQGKALLLAISSTHCAPCRKQDLELDNIVRLYQDTSSLALIHIFTEIKQPQELSNFLKTHPLVRDAYIADTSLMTRFKFDGVPDAILLNKLHEIVWIHRGFPPSENVEHYRMKLLTKIRESAYNSH
ncbi:MAG: TlpA family protein disulfide reductase [Bacteroidia bacterium]